MPLSRTNQFTQEMDTIKFKPITLRSLQYFFGKITEVDEGNSEGENTWGTFQVAVESLKGEKILDGKFFPLITPLDEIHLKYGPLKPGLVAKVWWRGEMSPDTIEVEVIGPEGFDPLKKEPMFELKIGPTLLIRGISVL